MISWSVVIRIMWNSDIFVFCFFATAPVGFYKKTSLSSPLTALHDFWEATETETNMIFHCWNMTKMVYVSVPCGYEQFVKLTVWMHKLVLIQHWNVSSDSRNGKVFFFIWFVSYCFMYIGYQLDCSSSVNVFINFLNSFRAFLLNKKNWKFRSWQLFFNNKNVSYITENRNFEKI